MSDEELKQEFQGIRDELARTNREVDARFDRLTDYLAQFKREVIAKLDGLDAKVVLLSATTASLDMRMPPLAKSVGDLQASAGQILQDRLESDLARRVEELERAVEALRKPAA